MRDVAEQSVGWLVLAGIVLAIVLARKRYQNKFANAVAAAAEGGRAEVRAELGQHVNVAVDASHHGATATHSCADPWSCQVCAPVLFRVLRSDRHSVAVGAPGGSLTTGINDDDDHYDHHYYDNDRRMVERADRIVGAVVSEHGGSGESDRSAAGDVGTGGDVAFVSRPALVADMLRRPWAYDEADPRFERGVPVANGRRGRGPGR